MEASRDVQSDEGTHLLVEPVDDMVFLRTRREGSSTLKTLISWLMTLETRYLAEARDRAEARSFEDDDSDLDMFGRPDERFVLAFDWQHFFFTLLRACFMWFFSVVYLFSPRFSVGAKLFFISIGILNVGVISMPVVAYQVTRPRGCVLTW